jgi:hypothetical protein
MRRTQRRAVLGSGRGSSGTQGRRQSRRQRARRIEGSRGSIDSSRSEAWLDVGTVLGVGGQCGEQSRWHWAPNHEDSTTYASPPTARLLEGLGNPAHPLCDGAAPPFTSSARLRPRRVSLPPLRGSRAHANAQWTARWTRRARILACRC